MTEGPPPSKPDGGDRPSDPADGLSWSDWEERTQQKEAPSTELLDAMKHPDVPSVVLEAIARRSSTPPPNVEPIGEEQTNRYILAPGAPITARIAEARGADAKAARRLVEPDEESLAMAYVLGSVMISVVLAWLSFAFL